MAASTLVRRVLLQVDADDADAEAKLDAIKAKADALREANPELVARIDTAEAQAKMRVLKQELQEAGEGTEIEVSTEEAAGQLDALKTELEETKAAAAAPLEVTVSSAEAQAKLDAIKVNAEELRALNPTLVPQVDTAEANAKLAVLRGELTSTAEESGGLAKAWEVSKYALLGVAGAAAYGTYKAAGFQSQMTLLKTQAGASTQTMNQMSTGVLQLAGQLGQNPDSLAEAAYHVTSNMASMGATAPQMLNAVKVAAQGASVGHANLVDVTNALGAAIASGIPGVQNYQQAMGQMNATVGAGDMNMQQLSEAFGQGNLATVKGYGATLTDVGSILATFGDNNLRGAAAGTEMRMAVQALAQQASTAGPALAQLGLSAGQIGAYQEQHGTVSTLNMLNDRMKAAGLTAKTEGPVITELFGKKAGSGISTLLEQMDRVNSKVPQLEKGAKGFSAAWNATQQTPAQKLKQLESGSEALAISLGTKLLPMATRVVGGLTDFVNALERGNGFALTFAGTIGSILGLVAMRKAEEGIKGVVEGIEGLYKDGAKAVGWARQLAGKLSGLKSAGKDAADGLGDVEKAAQETSGDKDPFAWMAKGLGNVKSSAGAAANELNGVREAAAGTGEGEDAFAWMAKGGASEAGEAEGQFSSMGDEAKSALGGIQSLATTAATKMGLLKTATNDVKVATEGEAVATEGADAAMDANPIGLIVLAVAGLVIGIVELVKHWHDVAHAFDVVRHDIAAGVDDLVSFVKSHWQLLIEIMTGTELVAVVAQHWHQIENGAKDAVGGVVRFFRGLPGDIEHAVGDLGHLLLSAGREVISGLVRGVEGDLGDVTKIAGDIGHKLLGGFKSVLGIASPSRAMATAGQQTVQGLANGISASKAQAMQAMEQMSVQVRGAAVDSLPGHAVGAASAADVIRGLVGTAAEARLKAKDLSVQVRTAMADGMPARSQGVQSAKAVIAGLNDQADAAQRSAYDLGAKIRTPVGTSLQGQMRTAGTNAASGLLGGLQSMAASVVHEAGSLASGLLGGFKSVLGIASPSTEMYAAGQDITKGLALGLTDGTTQVKSMATDLGAAITQAVDAGRVSTATGDSLTAWVTSGNKQLQQLAAQRQDIVNRINAAKSLATSTASTVEGQYDLSSAAGSGSSTLSASQVVGSLSQDVTQIRQFSANIQKLAGMGLNKTYLSQLISMGPSQGGQLAAELASSGLGDIKQINAAQSAITSASTGLGQMAGSAMYGTGAQAGAGFVAGLQAQESAINAVMSKVANSMVGTLRKDLGIASPSRVMREHGQMVGEGLALGIEDSVSRVRQSSTRMVQAVTQGAAAHATAAAAAAQQPRLTIQLVGGDKEFRIWLKKQIRVTGGDVTVVGA